MRHLTNRLTQVGLCSGLLLSLLALPSAAEQELRQGLPGRRISGGTRSECMANSRPIVAMNPESNIGETMSNHPSVYFVVPETETAYPLEFSLRDSEGNRVYEKTLNTNENIGVVGIQLPQQSLQANQNYRWHLAIVCDTQDPFQNDVLSGWLRQVSPEFATENQFNETTPSSIESQLELAHYYQESGLWTDAIDLVVTLRQQQPMNPQVLSSWNQLLQALDLETAITDSVAMK